MCSGWKHLHPQRDVCYDFIAVLCREKIKTSLSGAFPMGCKNESPSLEPWSLERGLGANYTLNIYFNIMHQKV
jgi:hypothetical protein